MTNTPSPNTEENPIDDEIMSLVPERFREGVIVTAVHGRTVTHGKYRTYSYYKCRCVECVQAYRDKKERYRGTNRERERAQDRAQNLKRRAFIDELKSAPCTDCGVTFPPECMDFDHIPEKGEKVAPVGHLFSSASQERLEAEIAKCELVCSNCHRIRTKNRRLVLAG
jgi:hypothetical protein